MARGFVDFQDQVRPHLRRIQQGAAQDFDPGAIADRPGRHVQRHPDLRVALHRHQAQLQGRAVDFAAQLLLLHRCHEVPRRDHLVTQVQAAG
jgi:hypothetical protein